MTLHLRATGDAPILKRNKFTISGTNTVGTFSQLLRKQLQLKESDSLVRRVLWSASGVAHWAASLCSSCS